MIYLSYISAFILANFIVLWYGEKGIIFNSLLLIPFDFVLRCMFHEQWKGKELIFKLGSLVIAASVITYLINKDSLNIALGSAFGFISAQIVASIFYQAVIKHNYFIKVNGSDLVGIIADSIVFQLVAFNFLDLTISGGQILLKMFGGLFWYWIIFKKLKLQNK